MSKYNNTILTFVTAGYRNGDHCEIWVYIGSLVWALTKGTSDQEGHLTA